MAQKPATPEKTYGFYRVEILAALANAVVLFFISFYILYEAYGRFKSPPEVASLPMMLIAVVGLGINLLGFWMLKEGAKESLNVQGAFLEVVSDALGSVGVIIAGAIMLATGWYYADPIFSVFIGLFILPRTWKLLTQAVNVLLRGNTCPHQPRRGRTTDADGERGRRNSRSSCVDYHVGNRGAQHARGLANDCDPKDGDGVLEQLAALLKEKFGIDHSTIQIEKSSRHEKEMQH